MSVTFTGAFQRPARRPSFLSVVEQHAPNQLTVPVVTSCLLKPPHPRENSVQKPFGDEAEKLRFCTREVNALLESGAEWEIFKEHKIVKISHPPHLPIFSEMRILVKGVIYLEINSQTKLDPLSYECSQQCFNVSSRAWDSMWHCLKPETKAYIPQDALDIWWLRVQYPEFQSYIEVGHFDFS